jgi:hypothetical protein
MSGARPSRPPLFTLRTLVILIAAALFGLGAGWLTYLGSPHPAAAVLAGFGAFGACLVGLHQLVE